MTITHVSVPDAVGDRGIAAALMEAALAHARASGWRVMPKCPYAAHYVRETSRLGDILAAEPVRALALVGRRRAAPYRGAPPADGAAMLAPRP